MRLSCLEGIVHFRADSYSFTDEFAQFETAMKPTVSSIAVSRLTMSVPNEVSGVSAGEESN